jgi:hypothetical protein
MSDRLLQSATPLALCQYSVFSQLFSSSEKATYVFLRNYAWIVNYLGRSAKKPQFMMKTRPHQIADTNEITYLSVQGH